MRRTLQVGTLTDQKHSLKDSLAVQVSAFTATRVILNTMHRMVYPFLPIIGRGLGVGLPMLSLALTIRSLSGVGGLFLAPVADLRGRKQGMLFGLLLFTGGVAIVALRPSFFTFVLALILTMLGKYVFDPAMQAYLGDRVPYQKRGRILAITEMAWSLAFIVGVPAVGFLMANGSWSTPFSVLALLGFMAMLVLGWLLPRDPARTDGGSTFLHNLKNVISYPPALLGLGMGLFISAANEVINLVFGVWMEDTFQLKILALGAASAMIGIAELGGEGITAAVTDRLGKTPAISIGLILNSIAVLALPFLGRTLSGAMVGLFLFYITFEFAVVSSIPLMTEVYPPARATIMAMYAGSFSLGRAFGALISAPLYLFGQSSPTVPGILPSALATIGLNLMALVVLSLLHRRQLHHEETGML